MVEWMYFQKSIASNKNETSDGGSAATFEVRNFQSITAALFNENDEVSQMKSGVQACPTKRMHPALTRWTLPSARRQAAGKGEWVEGKGKGVRGEASCSWRSHRDSKIEIPLISRKANAPANRRRVVQSLWKELAYLTSVILRTSL
jgi:hypothetical protein